MNNTKDQSVLNKISYIDNSVKKFQERLGSDPNFHNNLKSTLAIVNVLSNNLK